VQSDGMHHQLALSPSSVGIDQAEARAYRAIRCKRDESRLARGEATRESNGRMNGKDGPARRTRVAEPLGERIEDGRVWIQIGSQSMKDGLPGFVAVSLHSLIDQDPGSAGAPRGARGFARKIGPYLR
jgi:hypothetical protein